MMPLLIRILKISIPLPIGVLIAIALWLHFDKGSAVRRAVNSAVVNLVHSAEIEAGKAREAGLHAIIAQLRVQAERDRQAYQRFAALLESAENRAVELIDEIAELENAPAPDSCAVDSTLLDRLRQSR